ncbi:MAG: hypothetical protein DYG93_05000 [Leptolyngbya sp. PLA2]|nr:hypothetical protein [Leptolyngbya sp.]MCE7971004.1 hypothetical protein [Leptolyngbya sp. PL-A2]MCZ7631925.1 hypothetical protein [Phycisphaerales bacterium]MDL1905314.1 hypothetical protein [Synechococcales cyanobacterium CNB]GIK20270.1 MAG: hypothetical protein BroJett004_24340 [Planctomycetota bacterium]
MRDRYVELALPYIPRLLQLIDRNPYSPTYGSFDRAFWHYRTMDFPCGMAQEMVLPLALVYARRYPGNRFFGVERVRELAEAAVRYMVPSSHADGTCDDYFPFERAMGALVFSLYSASETYQLLGMDDTAVVDLFLKRVRHLAHENETGRLSNHQALAALAAYNVYLITGDDVARRVAEDRIALTLGWQHEEGWFQEYEGADPGYHTCTIDFLAKLMQKMRQGGHADRADDLIDPLVRAVGFAWHFMHPDGSYGGEYGSRNTYHFYPHGFEVMAPHTEKAGQIADAFLAGVPGDKRYHNDDDRMTAHYVYDFLQAWEDYHRPRPAPINDARSEPATVWMPGAKIAVSWNGRETEPTGGRYTVANLSKGGVLKVFDAHGPIASDTGLIGETADGRVVVTHLVQHDLIVRADPGTGVFEVEGDFCYRRRNQMTVLKQLILRAWVLTIGRFNANLTRSLVQKVAITGKPKAPYRFARRVEIAGDRVVVTDRFPADMPLRRLSVGSDATSIYVANSNVYQESVLCPWRHADPASLPVEGGWRVWRREYARSRPPGESAGVPEVSIRSGAMEAVS